MLALGLTPIYAHAERRVALVIGNGDYQHATKLPNPKNDARAIGQELTRIGFEVFAHEDLSGQAFRIALGAFAEEALRADLAVVFFAGHGIEINGQNFLIPTDAKMNSEAAAQFEAIALHNILASVRNAGKLGLVMLDACRDNPFAQSMERQDKTRSVSRGLAPVNLDGEAGTLVSFAAQAGSTADDGDGMHSPYTEALIQLLSTPNMEVGALFQKVTNVVRDKTDGRQKPMFRIQPPEELVYLVPAGQSVQPAPAPAQTVQDDPLTIFLNAMQTGQRAPLENFIARFPTHEKTLAAKRLLVNLAEDQLWEKMRTQDTVSGYESYLIAFPHGRYTTKAENRMAKLEPEAEPVPMIAPKPSAGETVGTTNWIKPSFNCAHASTVIENAICTNSTLARQDNELAAAFKQSRARHQVSDAQERLWVKLRARVCKSDIVDCVHAVTRERIQSLRLANGNNTESPSYSCTRARTAVEKAICGYGPLALQDQWLVRHYKAAVRYTNLNQAAWVKQREQSCGSMTGDSLALCVATFTASRIQQARPNGQNLHMGD